MALSTVEAFFHKIAQDGDVEQLKKMVNSKDEEDCHKTPIHKAAECGNLEMVKILIQMGANLDAKNDYGGTPLHYSAFYGKVTVAEYLIQMGAQTESSCYNVGNTALHHAARFGFIEIAKTLLQNRANIEAKDVHGRTPLHVAVVLNQTDMAKFLIENGAQINAQCMGASGRNSLHLAVFRNDHEAVKYLVENGAQVDVRDNENKTPFDVADEKQYFGIAKFLLEKKREASDKNPPNNISDKASCVICFSRRNGLFALNPCGHTILCEPCCYKLKNEPKSKCPNCRKPKPRLYENLFC